MTNCNVYVLDTSVFITASRFYYAFDIAPAFWEALIQYANKGYIVTIDKVRDEIEKGKDKLGDWVKNDFSKWIKSTGEEDVINAYREIVKWLNSSTQFKEAAKAQFMAGADGWIIAYAKVKGYIVVTQEVFNPEKKNKVPIPNVCSEFNVSYSDTFQMLRSLGIKFTCYDS
ncbi:DUF4411 family protein [Thermoanaerobacter sp. CM-CNRG TB177]|jgi:hypothetical protein|uniref:DUF4411 domain-containing protein n=1 Tax=Caldanaerobacter subterraneus TaxID=911092 RepID=A0A357VKF6_9THEO|nr:MULTISPECIES: DUF4411 family protein [Thermoanaerobacteraceae]MBT1280456.1 DUF4411 family protein [Thermoanaerobacter sp. CM-CNRG TB177]TCO55405.1 uncharacterized protein DUF4411 [Caldanaerobacter subterraneus]HBT48863.1 DUF4411 domain-containing protein [Caldanaerobacter subterraneus]